MSGFEIWVLHIGKQYCEEGHIRPPSQKSYSRLLNLRPFFPEFQVILVKLAHCQWGSHLTYLVILTQTQHFQPLAPRHWQCDVTHDVICHVMPHKILIQPKRSPFFCYHGNRSVAMVTSSLRSFAYLSPTFLPLILWLIQPPKNTFCWLPWPHIGCHGNKCPQVLSLPVPGIPAKFGCDWSVNAGGDVERTNGWKIPIIV